MSGLELEPPPVLLLGPVPVTRPMLTSLALTAVLALGAHLATRRLERAPGRLQALLELLVEGIAGQLRQVMGRDPTPFLPFLGALLLFVAAANLSAALPGVTAPTESLETPLALALLVFVSVHLAGVRARGLRGYLGHYLRPNPLLAPLHVLSELTRTFSLTMRLFGNMMSHGLVLAVVASLAGLLVPIPILALGLLIGLVQAWIFFILAATYVAAAIAAQDGQEERA